MDLANKNILLEFPPDKKHLAFSDIMDSPINHLTANSTMPFKHSERCFPSFSTHSLTSKPIDLQFDCDPSLMISDSAISSRRQSSQFIDENTSYRSSSSSITKFINRRKKFLLPRRSPIIGSHNDKHNPGIVFKFRFTPRKGNDNPVSIVKDLMDYKPNQGTKIREYMAKRRSSVPVIPQVRMKRTRASSLSSIANPIKVETEKVAFSEAGNSLQLAKDLSPIVSEPISQTENFEEAESNEDQLVNVDDQDFHKRNNHFSRFIDTSNAIKANIELMTVSRRISANKPIEGKQCAACNANRTPYWRDAWSEYLMLCNACGLRFQKFRLRCIECNYVPRKEDYYLCQECPTCGGNWA